MLEGGGEEFNGGVRPPAVAGRFYPADRERLRGAVAALLSAAPRQAAGAPPPKALIAPHAGYVFSGRTAAAAFAALPQDAPIDRVVLVGPAHYVAFRGIAVPPASAFDTPLGRVPLDRAALSAIAALPQVAVADAPHAPEHALEVELPFLQLRLGAFALVPLLVGEARPQEVAEVLRLLWGGPETLIVASSDLSHFLPFDAAGALDAATAAAVESGDWLALGPDRACGHLAIAGLLIEAARHGLEARRLALGSSADAGGSRGAVVGYGAWAL